MSTPLSRQMDQMADAQEWRERAEAAEAETERLREEARLNRAAAEKHYAYGEAQKERAEAAEAEAERLRGALGDACDRMERARFILTDGGPTPACNWAMLDTDTLRAALRGGGE